jgi:hypothetical protein
VNGRARPRWLGGIAARIAAISIAGLILAQLASVGIALLLRPNELQVFQTRWLVETLGSQSPSGRPRRSFVVTAVNDGNAIRRWTFKGAWIAAIAQGSLDTTSYDFAVERVSLGYDKIACELLG